MARIVNCELLNDITRKDNCGYSLKQITRLFLANFSDVTATELGDTGASVASITMKSAAKWHEIEFNKDSASYTDALQVGNLGSKYRLSTLNFSYGGKYDADAVDNIDALSLGRFVAVLQLSDGSFVMMGRLAALEATQSDLISEAEANGFNGVQVVMTANSTESPLPLDEAAIKTVLGE